MNRIYTLLTISLFMSVMAFSQVTMKLGSLENVQPGTYVNVPLTVSGLSATGQSFIGLELSFNFQESIISYDSLANGNTVTPVNQWFAGTLAGRLSANWLEPGLAAVNVADNSTLVEFVFFYTGGQTDLIFDESTTMIYDVNGNIIPVSQYINGSISQSQGSGNSVWNGTADWSQAANWSNGIPGDSTNAEINSGVIELSSGGVCRNLTIAQGAKLIINPGYSLTVNGNFDNNGEILIHSDSLIQGSLIINGNVSQTGLSTMNYKIYEGLNYQISSSVAGANAGIFTGFGPVSIFNENTNNWSAMPSNSVLEPGKGYDISASGDHTIGFTGQFISQSVTSDLSFTSVGNTIVEGWNLVGNSFTSSFDADQYLVSQHTDRAIYCWDGSVYRVWNGTAGSVPNGIIPPMTGFFVKANASNANVIFEKAGKVHDFNHFGLNLTAPQNVLQVSLRNFDDLAIEDKAFVQVEPTSTFYYDGAFDALKLNNSVDYPELYLHSFEDYRMAIAAIPQPTDIDAGVRIPADGTYVISAETFSFMPDRPVYLIDKELEIVKNLRNEDYVFIVLAGDYPNRFKVVLSGLGIDDMDSNNGFRVFAGNGGISINSLIQHGNCTIKVFDVSGRLISENEEVMIEDGNTTIQGIRGLNIISIETQKGTMRYKVFSL
ncbi:MAG: hypothetical protein HOO86_03045 [Bacteroidales bacterium]|nr:hypothetical protein [Bacteroidales bacterium]